MKLSHTPDRFVPAALCAAALWIVLETFSRQRQRVKGPPAAKFEINQKFGITLGNLTDPIISGVVIFHFGMVQIAISVLLSDFLNRDSMVLGSFSQWQVNAVCRKLLLVEIDFEILRKGAGCTMGIYSTVGLLCRTFRDTPPENTKLAVGVSRKVCGDPVDMSPLEGQQRQAQLDNAASGRPASGAIMSK